MTIYSLIFATIWSCGVLFGGIAFLISSLDRPGVAPASLIPWGMFIFFYVLLTFFYNRENARAKNDWKQILEADIEDSSR